MKQLYVFNVLSLLLLCANAGMNLDNYKLVWNQDFTTMDKLSVSPEGPGTTWIAHTPSNKDWVCFMNPDGPFMPFNVGGGEPLTIRAQKYDNRFCGGLLSSVDSKGQGFSQGYGYFEMMAQLPPGPGTWPAFWLLDVPALVNGNLNAQEIDIVEQYADSPAFLHTTLHLWEKNGTANWSYANAPSQCTMTTGFHTYGLDLQPDYLTFYYDRLATWQIPNNIPKYNDKFDRTYYVLVNLALEPWAANLTSPQDMLVKYVKVWSGSGGSKEAFDSSSSDHISWGTTQFKLNDGDQIKLSNVTLLLKSGDLQVNSQNGQQLWHSDTTQSCTGSGCYAFFQNDGNFLLFNNGKPYWGSSTYGDNTGSLTFMNTEPYLEIQDTKCNILWSTWGRP